MPSKKLLTKQSIEGGSGPVSTYNWTLDSKGYPSKVEVNGSRVYEYSYDNCKLIQ